MCYTMSTFYKVIYIISFQFKYIFIYTNEW